MRVRLAERGGGPFSPGRAAVFSVAWGLGAGIGVAAGAFLTVVGEAGAPGMDSLDFGSDIIALPLAVAVGVGALHAALQLGVAAARGRGGDDASSSADGPDEEGSDAEAPLPE